MVIAELKMQKKVESKRVLQKQINLCQLYNLKAVVR